MDVLLLLAFFFLLPPLMALVVVWLWNLSRLTHLTDSARYVRLAGILLLAGGHYPTYAFSARGEPQRVALGPTPPRAGCMLPRIESQL